jgi:hypothetical protein
MRSGAATRFLAAHALVFWCHVAILVPWPRRVAGTDFCVPEQIKHNSTQLNYTIAAIFELNPVNIQATGLTLEFINKYVQGALDPPIRIKAVTLSYNNVLEKVFAPKILIARNIIQSQLSDVERVRDNHLSHNTPQIYVHTASSWHQNSTTYNAYACMHACIYLSTLLSMYLSTYIYIYTCETRHPSKHTKQNTMQAALGGIDFYYSEAAVFSCLEKEVGASAISTIQRKDMEMESGGVIFVRNGASSLCVCDACM